MDEPNRKADGAGVLGIEAIEEEVAPLRQHDEQGHAGDQSGFHDVAPGDAQHVAEQDVVQVLVCLDLGHEHEPKAEHAGEDDAHDSIFFHAAVFLEIAREQRAGEAGGEGADSQGKAGDEGEHDARKNGMGNGVAHQRPSAQDEIARENRAHRADENGRNERALHELIGEGRGEEVEDGGHCAAFPVASPDVAACLRAASIPCLGARKNAARKSRVCKVTITPPVAPSMKKLR